MISRFGLLAVCLGAAAGCSGGIRCIEIRPQYAGAVALPAAYAYYAARTDGSGRLGGEDFLPGTPLQICTEPAGKDESWTLQAWIIRDSGCPPYVSSCAPNPGDPQGATDFVFKRTGTTVVEVAIRDPSP
jgi:hypothetical protein